ncbi:MAG: exodeoxyribonuclease V subunit gamma [Candidatus Marinimicrobia bacterium]|nr:exodeoxyribonuclease V subunit gamma [Candidatus Neomarinimicrobiota bacterium]
MNIFLGNNLEKLLQRHLLDKIRSNPLPDPFQKEIIIVQNQGMAVWLRQWIARELGIACNIDFPFINGFIQTLFEDTLDPPPDKDFFHPYVMTWKIWQLLKQGRFQYQDLNNYLLGDETGLKHYQLAAEIARCFDQYQIYRPDEIMADLEGLTHDFWQQDIWREISAERTNRAQTFDFFLRIQDASLFKKYKRIFIVGIFSMPPIFLDFFRHLSEFIEVNLFFIYPADISKQHYHYSGKITHLKVSEPKTLNPFLETLGKAGLDFYHLLRFAGGNFQTSFTPPEEDSLLHLFQSSLFEANPLQQKIPAEKNATIQIHNCHSRMREVEVLKNNILNLLNHDNLTPADILVMMPNIADYSPYIKAVFDRKDILSQQQDLEIPFSITDNSVTFETPVDQVFLKLLEIHKSRFEASVVMDLLEQEVLYKKLQLSEEDVELCRKWIAETNIRWGLSGEQRKKEWGLIPFEESSWEKGLNRMFLGYCLKDEDLPNLHFDYLPYDMFEGHNNFVLGKMSCFVAMLAELHEEYKKTDSIENWQKKLLKMVEDFFWDFEDFQKDIKLLRQKILKLTEETRLAEISSKISIEIIQHYFRENLNDEFQTSRYFQGGVTFSTLQPLRNIPARVLCIMGMKDSEFPRNEHFDSFNILSDERRCSDRIKREEDQYLFLEALLAARQYLIISYTGQDIKSNDVSEPASPVCELRDYLKKLFGDSVFNRIYFQHKLQSYNPAYFSENSALISYSNQDFGCQMKRPVREFYQNPVAEIKEISEIYLEDLIKTLSNSARFFTEEVLGATLRNWQIDIQDSEKFELDNLDKYSLNQLILDQILNSVPKDITYKILKARDDLPIAMTGHQLFESSYSEIETFLKKSHIDNGETLKAYLGKAERLSFEFDLKGVRIFGHLPRISRDTLFYVRYANFKGKDALKSWIYHLAGRISGQAHTTFAITRDKSYQFPEIPLENAKEALKIIIDNYNATFLGPITFFPNTSFAFVSKKPSFSTRKRDVALKAWNGGYNTLGEKEDEYFRLFFSEKDIKSPEFEKVSKNLLKPFARFFDEESDYQAIEVKE